MIVLEDLVLRRRERSDFEEFIQGVYVVMFVQLKVVVVFGNLYQCIILNVVEENFFMWVVSVEGV